MSYDLFLEGSVWNHSSTIWIAFQQWCKEKNIDISAIEIDDNLDKVLKRSFEYPEILEAIVNFKNEYFKEKC